jgi:hypothetical protein
MSSDSADATRSKLSPAVEGPSSNNDVNPADKQKSAKRLKKADDRVEKVEQAEAALEGIEAANHPITVGTDDVDHTDNGSETSSDGEGSADAPPLPEEDIPPLPQEPLPMEDDGWAPVWDQTAQAFYFYNRFTGATQWTNPRVPEASQFVKTAPGVAAAPGTSIPIQLEIPAAPRPAGGYDPSIHGDYDPTAWYAQPLSDATDAASQLANPADAYAATGAFNRFTGRWQAADIGPELHNDENKSKRQMNAFFDVDAAANSHDGRSLKAERSGKKLSKSELKQFKEKRKAKKEEKRRAWLRD